MCRVGACARVGRRNCGAAPVVFGGFRSGVVCDWCCAWFFLAVIGGFMFCYSPGAIERQRRERRRRRWRCEY